MKITLESWIQIATSIAVLIGLGLVVYEIQQTQKLARAEFGSEAFHALNATLQSNIGESFQTAMTKSCVSPASLTDTELTELRYHYFMAYATVNRQRLILRFAGFDDSVWTDVANDQFGRVFSTQPGRAWWETHRFWSADDKELTRVIDGVFRNRSFECSDLMQDFFEKARATDTTGSDR